MALITLLTLTCISRVDYVGTDRVDHVGIDHVDVGRVGHVGSY